MLLAFTEGAFLIDRKNKFRRVQVRRPLYYYYHYHHRGLPELHWLTPSIDHWCLSRVRMSLAASFSPGWLTKILLLDNSAVPDAVEGPSPISLLLLLLLLSWIAWTPLTDAVEGAGGRRWVEALSESESRLSDWAEVWPILLLLYYVINFQGRGSGRRTTGRCWTGRWSSTRTSRRAARCALLLLLLSSSSS